MLKRTVREEASMSTDYEALKGEWTYRSFLNNPKPVNGVASAALALIFGEGALTIETVSPQEGFRATLSFGGDAVMDLAGSVEAGDGDDPPVISANGRGRAGSPISDFRYDYIFYPVPAWPDGIDQRPALVGTVVRAADHGAAKKGATASTITVKLD
jgi:hypothetical protein